MFERIRIHNKILSYNSKATISRKYNEEHQTYGRNCSRVSLMITFSNPVVSLVPLQLRIITTL